MVKKLFVVLDKFEGVVLCGIANTAAHFIRSSIRGLIQSFPLVDLTLYKVGEIDTETGEIVGTERVKCEWSEYKFPATKAESLAPLGEEAIQAFNEKVEETKKETDNYEA